MQGCIIILAILTWAVRPPYTRLITRYRCYVYYRLRSCQLTVTDNDSISRVRLHRNYTRLITRFRCYVYYRLSTCQLTVTDKDSISRVQLDTGVYLYYTRYLYNTYRLLSFSYIYWNCAFIKLSKFIINKLKQYSARELLYSERSDAATKRKVLYKLNSG